MSQDAEIVLTQKHRVGGERTLTLFEQRYLRVRQRRRRGASLSYTLDLLALAPGSERHWQLRWGWLVAAVLALLVAGIATLFALHPPAAAAGMPWLGLVLALVAVVLLLVGVLCAYRFATSMEHRQLYATRYGGVPLVELWVNQPDKGFYQAFVQELERAVISSEARVGDMGEQALKAGELRLLRRMSGKGVIDEAAYETAKSLILMQGG